MSVYGAFAEVASDPAPGLSIGNNSGLEDVLVAVEARLKEVQSLPVEEVGDLHRRLVEARQLLKQRKEGVRR